MRSEVDRGRGSAAPRKRRVWRRALAWALRLAFVTAVAWAMFLPYPYQTGGPFRFPPAKRAEVRSEVGGLVDKVLVHERQWVEQGQAIATISPRTHRKNLKAAQAKLDETKAELQILKAGPKREEVERAKADVRTAETSLAWSGPRARAITEIPNPDGVLKTDMTGFAKIATGDRPVWDVLFRPIIRWVKVEVWYWIP